MAAKTKTLASSSSKYKRIQKRITHKQYRKFGVKRATTILDVLPQFVKFYKKLDANEIMAIKYYKGPGSFFQSKLLSEYGSNTKQPRKINFPFNYSQEKMLIRDIVGQKVMPLIQIPTSLDIKDIHRYIYNSYSTRITLLNRLDSIYDKPECPKLKGGEILFRGMSENTELKKLKEGQTFTFKNFISTSVDRLVAEVYSHSDYIFVLTEMKDIPFLYMPNRKIGGDDYVAEALNESIEHGLSEYTLPRNLEFTITKITEQPITEGWNQNKNATIKNILKVLKNKGLGSDIPSETQKRDIVEKQMYSNAKFVYCTLKMWHPRKKINVNQVLEGAEFVLDKLALQSWINMSRQTSDNNDNGDDM
jgi:hypothetical protein